MKFAGNKHKSPARHDLADEMAAFANTKGGVLLCGVNDLGEVQGLTRTQLDTLEKLVKELCTDAIKPPINPIIVRKELQTGKPFLLVEIPSGYAQHSSPGGNYHRVGSSKQPMADDASLPFSAASRTSKIIFGLINSLCQRLVLLLLTRLCGNRC